MRSVFAELICDEDVKAVFFLMQPGTAKAIALLPVSASRAENVISREKLFRIACDGILEGLLKQEIGHRSGGVGREIYRVIFEWTDAI